MPIIAIKAYGSGERISYYTLDLMRLARQIYQALAATFGLLVVQY